MLKKRMAEVNGALALLGAVAYGVGRLRLPVKDSEMRLQSLYIGLLVGGACALSLALGAWVFSSLSRRGRGRVRGTALAIVVAVPLAVGFFFVAFYWPWIWGAY